MPRGLRLQYRAEIDGLRAIAIIPVVLFHAGVGAFAGGFIGVDVFFVISGYLITSIIRQEVEAGTFSVVRFYERRARRILPALYFMILLCIPAAYFILVPYQIKDLSQGIIATVAFLSNYFFYLETDYFDPFTNKSPLLHTWTLSVEEQFYVVFPLLLLGISKVARRMLTPALVAILAASFASAVYLTESNSILSFYATHTRAWELMAGALVAIHQQRLAGWIDALAGRVGGRRSSGFVALAALAAIVACVFVFSAKTPTPSFSTIVPVAGTVLLLLLGTRETVAGRLLSRGPMVAVGKLSYSLYIFHQPVNSYLYYTAFGERHADTWQLTAVSLLITVALSLFSYWFVERPIRYSDIPSRRSLFAGVSLLAVAFVLVGYGGNYTGGLRDHMAAKYSKAGNILLVDVDAEKKSVSGMANRVYWKYDGDFESADIPRILVVGDSMANDAFLSLIKFLEAQKVPRYSVRPLRIDDDCLATFEGELRTNAQGRSACFYEPTIPEINLHNARNLIQDADIILMTSIWQENTYQNAYEFSRYLGAITKAQIFVVGTMLFNDTTSMSLRFAELGIKPQDSTEMMYKNLRFDRLRISDKLRSLVLANPRLRWIEKRDHLCDMQQQRCAVFYKDGYAMIRDGAHLTFRSYEAFGAFLVLQIGVK